MKRTKRYLISFVLVPILGLGQGEGFNIMSNSSQIIEQLNSRAKEITTFQCDFKQQKYMSYLDAIVESKGTFMFKNQTQIRWEYTNPYQYLIVINNGKVSFRNQNQSQHSVPKENKLLDQLNEIIKSIFNGNLGQDKNFSTSFYENVICYRLNLVPKSTEMKACFNGINLSFNKTSLDITSVQIIEVSGDYTTLSFEKPLFNKPIPDAEFTIL
jgi:outer membrane lipoprotein-sorting protein